MLENQTFLRKRLNSTPIKDKITIDERDKLNIYLCNTLKNQIELKIKPEYMYSKFENTSQSIIFELKDFHSYYQASLEEIEIILKTRSPNILILNFINSLEEKVKIKHKIVKKMDVKESNSLYTLKDSQKEETLSRLSSLKEKSYSVFKNILNTFYEDMMYNDKSEIDLIDVLFLSIFQPHLYEKLIHPRKLINQHSKY